MDETPFERAATWPDNVAIGDRHGTHTYAALLAASERVAARLLGDDLDLEEGRVVFMVEPSFGYVVAQWATWRAGGVAVPLCLTDPAPQLEYAIDVTGPVVAVASARFAEVLRPLAERRGIRFIELDELETDPVELPQVSADRRAMILFTSGTTGRPKGVVLSHGGLAAQMRTLSAAWGWAEFDRTLLTLPLHHLHGIVNVLGCALWNGARCDIADRFDAAEVVEALAGGDLSVYMAVPTLYHRLIAHLDGVTDAERRRFRQAAERLRLMVSGSAALPVPVLERWRDLTGHTLLERYGMTEIGMALSNPYRGERLPGSVGFPLPGIDVMLVDEDDRPVPDGVPGEIQVRGPTVFTEYWKRPEETADAFTADGWFRTGDTATVESGRYRILGRSSVDILKTGGEKVSALEIEEVLLQHPAVAEAAVVGVEDPEWGQRVVAVVVANEPVEAAELRDWMRARLAPHKVPKDYVVTDALPRNPMGKVVKSEVARLAQSD